MSENFKIFKYPIALEKEQVIEMPQSAQILDVQMQLQTDGSGSLVMWALVLPSQPSTTRRLVMIDTGEEIPGEVVESFNHVRTVQTIQPREVDGELVAKSIVVHLFLERGVVN